MDEFEQRLKQDAAKFRAEVTPELVDRLESSLHSVGRDRPVPAQGRSTGTLWWASSLTGLAMALAVIVLVNWTGPEVSSVNTGTGQETVKTVPDDLEYPGNIEHQLVSPTISVQLTGGLEEELYNLQADFEKARENVARDIDFTF